MDDDDTRRNRDIVARALFNPPGASDRGQIDGSPTLFGFRKTPGLWLMKAHIETFNMPIFDTLPTEVLIEIFRHLEVRERRLIASVHSRAWEILAPELYRTIDLWFDIYISRAQIESKSFDSLQIGWTRGPTDSVVEKTSKYAK